MNERRLIVEKIKILTEEIRELEKDAIYLDEDNYIEVLYTARKIEEYRNEIKELNKEIKKY